MVFRLWSIVGGLWSVVCGLYFVVYSWWSVVFMLSSSPQAHQVFLRSKRANLFLVEEILQGNLERECYEETCDYEEAREYFEDTQRTCESKPCLHGGNCTDQVGGFSCTCMFVSDHIWSLPEVLQCPTAGPTVCQQMCTVSGSAFSCSCLQGFKLQTDGRTCRPQDPGSPLDFLCPPSVAFPCGRLPDVNTTVSACHHGNCPWQVSSALRGEELCGGVVLTHRSVLSSARCLVSTLTPPVYAFPVRAIRIHDRFQVHRHDYDLALLHLLHPVRFSSALIHLCLPTRDFSENILMHSGRSGVTSRPAHGGNQDPVYVTLEECRQDLNVPHPLSNKMFCMRNQNQQTRTGPPGTQRDDWDQTQTGPQVGGGDCRTLLLGTPVATEEQGVVYLTGILTSTPVGCGDRDGLVYTKVSRHLNWIKPRLEEAQDHMTPQVTDYPEDR
uniref:Protein Z, vitamin K-dependent plasma glycoprotein b n=1 Tax=Sphaeramia orbicularis TaxID=375764 RepID=A0A672YEV6_9TELE